MNPYRTLDTIVVHKKKGRWWPRTLMWMVKYKWVRDWTGYIWHYCAKNGAWHRSSASECELLHWRSDYYGTDYHESIPCPHHENCRLAISDNGFLAHMRYERILIAEGTAGSGIESLPTVDYE